MLEDKIDFLVDICYLALSILHNQTDFKFLFENDKINKSYSSFRSQNNKTIKQAFIFLEKFKSITITSVTGDSKSYTISFNHPMFYIQMLKKILGEEDMPIARYKGAFHE